MSSAGTSTCRRAIMPSVTSSGTPPSMKAMSAEVPPMSSVTSPLLRLVAGEIGARLRAGGRAGEQRVHGAAAGDRGGERHHAAVRLHQEALLGADAGVVEPAVEMVDVAHHHRLEIGVEQRGREPRPFADARQHLARQRHVHAGKFLVDDRRGSPPRARVHEREQVADRDRLDARGLQLARGAAHRVAVERREHVAGIVGALGDFPGQALRRDRRGLA